MVLCVKVQKGKGIKIKGFLKIKKVYEDEFLSFIEDNFVYLPVRKLDIELEKELKKKDKNIDFVQKELKKNNRTKSFRRELEKILPKKIYPKVSRAYEQIGTIAIIEISDLIKNYEVEIAQALLKTNNGVKTVLKKDGFHLGEQRLQKFIFLLGENTTKTIHFENQIKLKLDIEKTYFSTRTGNERKRIASLIEENDNVLVMFSGIGPFVCVIAKNSNYRKIVGVEINEIAHRFAIENLQLNHLKNIELFNFDVKDIKSKLKNKFDKIIMPSPTNADYFLDDAFSIGKDNLEIFMYLFSMENKLDKIKNKIIESSKKFNYKIINIAYNKQQKIKNNVYKFCIEIKAKKIS